MTTTNVLNLFFPLLKWGKTKTVWGKISLILDTIPFIWLYSLFFFFFYAEINYKKQTHEQVTIYTSSNRAINIKQQIDFLKTDPLYQKKSGIKVYFVHDKNLFAWLLAPATFVNYIFNFINHTNLVTRGVTFGSLIFFNSEVQTSNHISNDIAHELVHVLQSKKYGVFATLYSTPGWVNEGYATYRTHIFNQQPIDDMDINKKYKHFAKLIKHAIEDMNVTVNNLHQRKVKYEDILLSYCHIHKLKECDIP